MNETTSSTETVKLTHNSQVRVPALEYHSKIVIVTTEGFYAEHRKDYGNVKRDFPTASGDTIEWLAKQEAMTLEEYRQDQLEKGSILPSSSQSCSMICADYEGKAERMAAERAEEEASPALENGQVVEIEGELYTVRVGRVGTSDPVHFDKV